MKVLAVDDQERILKAIRVLIHWDELGVTEVFTADSAADAKRILNEEQIDILLTDIEMPGENGIELQRWQMENHPEVTSIFLTSHADFAYAKEAIRNGAFDYILQPASIPEIEETVTRCIAYRKEQQLLKEKSRRYEEKVSESAKALLFALFYQEDQFSRMEELRQDLKIQGKEYSFVPAVLEFEQDTEDEIEEYAEKILWEVFPAEEKVHFILTETDSRHLVFLFYSEKETPDIQGKLQTFLEALTENTGNKGRIHLGNFSEEELPEKTHELMEYFEGKILESGSVYCIEESPRLNVRKPEGAVWGRWMIRGDLALVRNQIGNLLNYAQEEKYLSYDYIRQILKAFLDACLVACYEQKREIQELFENPGAYEKIMEECRSSEQLIKVVDSCLDRYRRMLPEVEEENYTVHDRIQEILKYLDENMDRMISRKEAAKYVFLNEDYFSRVFLKETGKRYKEYVLDLKMDYAKKLLAGTDLPVTLIASKVGYDNFTNFSKMFRKSCGVTPTDYRKESKA